MINMIDIIENIHQHFVIHRDIKPDNFMIHNQSLFIIDFGLSSIYVDENHTHCPEKYRDTITGTPKYISPNIHHGIEPSRRDDLISIGYIYLFFLDELPWSTIPGSHETDILPNHVEHPNNIVRNDLKQMDKIEEIYGEKYPKIIQYLKYCYQLKYSETPNYEILKEIFTNE
jgi:serine/threonine protein kinase